MPPGSRRAAGRGTSGTVEDAVQVEFLALGVLFLILGVAIPLQRWPGQRLPQVLLPLLAGVLAGLLLARVRRGA